MHIVTMALRVTWVVLLFSVPATARAIDTDADGIPDAVDNCVRRANPGQHDADGDGFGEVCDADYNQDGVVDDRDGRILAKSLNGSPGDRKYCAACDHDRSGSVNAEDWASFEVQRTSAVVGPSGLSCADATLRTPVNPLRRFVGKDSICKGVYGSLDIQPASSAARPLAAPACVEFDLRASLHIAGSQLSYETEFGDLGCIVWDNWLRDWDASNCRADGSVVTHCYDVEGEYSIKAVVTDGAIEDVVSETVHVKARP